MPSPARPPRHSRLYTAGRALPLLAHLVGCRAAEITRASHLVPVRSIALTKSPAAIRRISGVAVSSGGDRSFSWPVTITSSQNQPSRKIR
jgi:hypothetical protein